MRTHCTLPMLPKRAVVALKDTFTTVVSSMTMRVATIEMAMALMTLRGGASDLVAVAWEVTGRGGVMTSWVVMFALQGRRGSDGHLGFDVVEEGVYGIGIVISAMSDGDSGGLADGATAVEHCGVGNEHREASHRDRGEFQGLEP